MAVVHMATAHTPVVIKGSHSFTNYLRFLSQVQHHNCLNITKGSITPYFEVNLRSSLLPMQILLTYAVPFYLYLCECCMFHLPFFQCYSNPETINSEGYYTKQKPFYPLPEQSNCCPVKFQSSSFNNRMVYLPSIYLAQSPWVANTKCY